MDFFQGLGNFLTGKGWRDNRAVAAAQADEERRRRQQQAQQQATRVATPQPRPPTATIAMPGQTNPASVFNISQPKQQPVQLQQPRVSALDQAKKQAAQQRAKVQAKPQEPNIVQQLGAGAQQVGAKVADVALQAGTVIRNLDPFKSEQQKTAEVLAIDKFRRDVLRGNRDITGKPYVGTTDVEQNAARINTGQANVEDYAKVFGSGLDVANAATSFVPIGAGLKIARGAIGTGARELAKEAATLGSTATAADITSGRGVSPESLAINYGAPVGFGVAGATVGAGFRGARNARNSLYPDINQGAEAQLRGQVLQPARNQIDTGISTSSSFERRADEALEEAQMTAMRERIQQEQQARQIETARRLEQQAADETAIRVADENPQPIQQPEYITTPFDQPTPIESAVITPGRVLQNIPEPARQAPPLELTPEQRAFQDSVEAVNQRQVEEPLPEPQAAGIEPPVQAIETPTETLSREIAEQTVPVDMTGAIPPRPPQTMLTVGDQKAALTPEQSAALNNEVEAIPADLFTDGRSFDKNIHLTTGDSNGRRNEVPLETLAQENPRVQQVLDSIEQPKVDPRIETADKQADELINFARKEIGNDTAYDDLVTKLYNNSKQGAIPEALTAAERKVASRIQPELNRVLAKMNDLGLTDADMGLIRDYLPTTKFDESGNVQTIDDVARQDFGFTEQRGGTLTDESVAEGADQALRNYLRTGAMLDDLPPEVIKNVKMERQTREFNDLIEKDNTGADTGLRSTDEDLNAARAINERLVDAEDNLAQVRKDANNSPESISRLNEAEDAAHQAFIDKQVSDYMALERKTDEALAELRASNLNPAEKEQRRVQLEAHLTDVRNQTYYLQSFARTNMLLGVGRLADQVNKATQSASDLLTGAIANRGANKSFKKSIGRDLQADSQTAKAVWDKIKSDKALNKAKTNAEITNRIVTEQTKDQNILARASGKYKAFGTKITEAGSRYKRSAQDTSSFFVAKARAEGLTNVDDIANYVQKSIGTKEWDRVYASFFDMRNKFTGLPSGMRAANQDFKFNPRNIIYNELGRVPGISRNVRDSIADGLTIPIIGFPRLIARLGVRGLDTATGGVGSFIKASRINPTNEAEALQKALLVRQGFQAAQNGASLGALGLMAGASGMVTGAYPKDDAERARWQRDKITPFSLKVGDQYIELGRYIGPMAAPFLLASTLAKGENPAEMTAELTKQMLSNYGADSVGDVMSTMGNLLKGDWDMAENDVNRWLAGIATAFAPVSSLLNTAGKAEDMMLDRAAPDGSDGIIEGIRSRLPVVRGGLPEKTDTLGNPITQGNALNLLPGISGGQGEKLSGEAATVASEIDRLAGLGFEAMPTKDVKNLEANSEGALIVDTELYRNATDEDKAKYLTSALKSSEENQKNISPELDDVSRKAMLQYSIMSGSETKGQRGKWLEDTTNARDYHVAAYENAIKNGTLTEEDDSLNKMSSKHYKAVASQVNLAANADPETVYGYKEITKSQFNAMSNDNPLKAKLWALDQARAEAGVSGNSKDKTVPKYGAKTSSGGSRGGGRGGSRSGGSSGGSFGELADIVAGSGSSGKSGIKYEGIENNQFANKPIPTIAKTPIPAKKTISVKRGIQL